jgi:hypothetical protein
MASRRSDGGRAAGIPWFSVLVPPVAWAVVMGVGWLMASQACPLGTTTRGAISVAAARLVIALLALVAAVVTLVGLIRVWRSWSFLGTPAGEEPTHVEEVRFFSLAGLLTAAALTLAIVFNGFAAIFDLCGRFR